MERNYTAYPAPRPEDNELYSLFKYTELKGLDYNDHDGTITRRDPSKVIFANGKYYVWYTHRHTPTARRARTNAPIRFRRAIGICATSGTPPPRMVSPGRARRRRAASPQTESRLALRVHDRHPGVGREVLPLLPGVLCRVVPAATTRGDDCPVAVSYADSPDGPWTPLNQVVIPNGAEGEWDQYSIHDPYPLVYKGKIYLYYKSDCDGDPQLVRMQGLAIADHPLGPVQEASAESGDQLRP